MAQTTVAGDFIETYYKPVDPKLSELRKANEESGIPLILKETEDMLSVLLEMTRPKNILEIGTAQGYSSIFFTFKCPDAKVTTIDRDEKLTGIAQTYVNELDLNNRIEILTGDASEILKDLSPEHPYDFVFIDAGKTHYREYFELSEKLCTPGALIVCDNILISGWVYDRSLPGAKRHRTSAKYMKEFLEYIKSREDLTVSISGGGDGLAIIKLNDR